MVTVYTKKEDEYAKNKNLAFMLCFFSPFMRAEIMSLV